MSELKRLPAYETHDPSTPCPKCGNVWFVSPLYQYNDRYVERESLAWGCRGCGFKKLTRCKDNP